MSAIYSVAVVGCGRMGQKYIDAYETYPDTQVVALVDPHQERLRVVAQRFGIGARFADVDAMLATVQPDVVAVVTPVKHMRAAVLACAEAGVRGIQLEKPIGGVLADADAMVDGCAARGVLLAGGNLQRAMHEVQAAARRLHSGEFGVLRGASVHGFEREIVGGGCQHLSVLRLFTGAEVERVVAWGAPVEALDQSDDEGLTINGLLSLSNGIACPVFGMATPGRGVDVWTEEALVRWEWGPPALFVGFDEGGRRRPIDPHYAPYEWSEFSYLTGSIRSFLAALSGDGPLWVSGDDLRRALEIAVALKESARRGSAPVDLPLADRSLSLYPRSYRWEGGDLSGEPQSLDEAAGH